ncbi:hypothetical protein GCM10010168_73910 [Actinoplanes ianthinogenes]|uniref:Uncharacterized protein n=1 Tax=Actinoplanes ianthinogenes TaxID=122358 RepID=A0ABM7LMV3_9ACTN|nr:hypothetical protein Aiant_12780 [Actinoplanes ianthinogenes]GGR44036.1 hypothetical protein GCM10010168_73910 [Actinoplanes ianthinogenes]
MDGPDFAPAGQSGATGGEDGGSAAERDGDVMTEGVADAECAGEPGVPAAA